jgi:hypothetical protein
MPKVLGYVTKAAPTVLGIAVLIVVLVKVDGQPGVEAAHKLADPDVPPLEFTYLDEGRVNAYLGQDLDGLAEHEERTEQISRTLKASITPGVAGSAEAGTEAQHKTTATVSFTAADHFFTFLELLRERSEAGTSRCNRKTRAHWLGEVDEDWAPAKIMQEIACIGVGNFVRISNAQLFLPPFAQALPQVQSTTAFYGALPAERTSFTSPTQLASDKFRAALAAYVKLVGRNPRMPFVAAAYGAKGELGGEGAHGRSVTFFLPAELQGLAHEPSLFSGSVTVVGKIVYEAERGAPYIDYPSVATFGRALLKAPTRFRTSLGVCSKQPPPLTLSAALPKRTPPSAGAPPGAATELQPLSGQLVHHAKPRKATPCTKNQRMIYDVKKSVRFKPPVVVVLPLAIYQ